MDLASNGTSTSSAQFKLSGNISSRLGLHSASTTQENSLQNPSNVSSHMFEAPSLSQTFVSSQIQSEHEATQLAHSNTSMNSFSTSSQENRNVSNEHSMPTQQQRSYIGNQHNTSSILPLQHHTLTSSQHARNSNSSSRVIENRLVRQGHQYELIETAKALCDADKFVDVKICCDDGIVHAHQMFLASASPLLQALFESTSICNQESDHVTVIIPDVNCNLIRALIHFIYTGRVVAEEDIFYELMKLVYTLNVSASIEAESTNAPPTKFNKAKHASNTNDDTYSNSSRNVSSKSYGKYHCVKRKYYSGSMSDEYDLNVRHPGGEGDIIKQQSADHHLERRSSSSIVLPTHPLPPTKVQHQQQRHHIVLPQHPTPLSNLVSSSPSVCTLPSPVTATSIMGSGSTITAPSSSSTPTTTHGVNASTNHQFLMISPPPSTSLPSTSGTSPQTISISGFPGAANMVPTSTSSSQTNENIHQSSSCSAVSSHHVQSCSSQHQQNIQLPTQPLPAVNLSTTTAVSSDDRSVNSTSALFLPTSSSGGAVTVLGGGKGQQQNLTSYIAVDPTTGVSYKLEIPSSAISAALTAGGSTATTGGSLVGGGGVNHIQELVSSGVSSMGEDSSDPLALIMNETIFTEAAAAAAAAGGQTIFTTENGQLVYATTTAGGGVQIGGATLPILHHHQGNGSGTGLVGTSSGYLMRTGGGQQQGGGNGQQHQQHALHVLTTNDMASASIHPLLPSSTTLTPCSSAPNSSRGADQHTTGDTVDNSQHNYSTSTTSRIHPSSSSIKGGSGSQQLLLVDGSANGGLSSSSSTKRRKVSPVVHQTGRSSSTSMGGQPQPHLTTSGNAAIELCSSSNSSIGDLQNIEDHQQLLAQLVLAGGGTGTQSTLNGVALLNNTMTSTTSSTSSPPHNHSHGLVESSDTSSSPTKSGVDSSPSCTNIKQESDCNEVNSKLDMELALRQQMSAVTPIVDEFSDVMFSCDLCPRTVKGKVMMQAHKFQDHYENPGLLHCDPGDKFPCRVCLKLFSRISDVKAHILRVHCGDRRYPCSVCGKRFKESTHLRKHLFTHTGERPHYCVCCKKGFQTSSDLKRHERTRVHQEKEVGSTTSEMSSSPTSSSAATSSGHRLIQPNITHVLEHHHDMDDDTHGGTINGGGGGGLQDENAVWIKTEDVNNYNLHQQHNQQGMNSVSSPVSSSNIGGLVMESTTVGSGSSNTTTSTIDLAQVLLNNITHPVVASKSTPPPPPQPHTSGSDASSYCDATSRSSGVAIEQTDRISSRK